MPNFNRIGSWPCLLGMAMAVHFITGSSASLAGGFDSSGQTFQSLFGDGNEIGLRLNTVRPSLSLVARRTQLGVSDAGLDVSSMADAYWEPALSVRWQVRDSVTCLFKWDQPFRFHTEYQDDSLAYTDRLGNERFAPLNSKYHSQSFNSLCRIGFDFSHRNRAYKLSTFSWIFGLRLQEIEGDFSSDLTSMDLGVMDNYHVRLEGSQALGFSAGFAYERPDIAFRFSLIFHSEIKHDLKGLATAPVNGNLFSAHARGKTLTPRSLNLRLQSGLSQTWLGFVNLRWGAWDDLRSIQVDAGILSQDINLFKSDTLNYQIGVAKKVSNKLNIAAYYASLIDLDDLGLAPGLDGSDIRNPQGKRFSLAIGAQYQLGKATKLGLGASYFFLKESRFADDFYTVELSASNALAVSGSFSYAF